MSRHVVCSAVLVLAFIPVVATGQVFLAQSTMKTSASDGSDTNSATDNAMLPWQFTRQVTKGSSSSTTMYDFTSSGDGASFHLGFNHVRGGNVGNLARSHGFFTVVPLQDMLYEISGNYQSTGGGITGLELNLRLNSTDLFRNNQQSSSAGNHSFVVGQQNGDQNLLTGSLSGTLTAFENYIFEYRLEVEESGGLLAASGNGDVYLNLMPVPEPATAGCLMVGAALCVARRRTLRV